MEPVEWVWPPDAELVAGERIEPGCVAGEFAVACGPVAECRVVLWVWRHEAALAPLSAARMAELVARYSLRLEAMGVGSISLSSAGDAAGFVRAPTKKGSQPSVHTMHLRRTALRSLCRTFHALGVTVGDPTTLLVLPSRSVRAARALTDSELQQVRMAVLTRRCDVGVAACVVAFAEAGASTAELTALTWANVHVGVPPSGRVGVDAIAAGIAAGTVDATVAGNSCGDVAVDLPGGGRLLARRVHLTQWGAGVVGQYQESAVWASESLVVSGSLFPPGSHSAQAAVTNRLRWLLRTAELHHVVGLGPRSFRLWGARHAYTQTGRIEDAAHVLGMRSLDATARAIGL